ncbi:MAG TPA: hypothetical protein VII66_00475, partial [Gemmatimonadaceae bacterium]
MMFARSGNAAIPCNDCGDKNDVAASLGKGDLHVWCIGLAVGQNAFSSLASVLSQAERDRAERYHAETDRRRFVVARGSLRYILS